ncbi:MAG: Ig-like domain-containing protein [Candidatus Riflebacteria bacterium]|nr:Ig-like domain-containing protein [Candidatus Riflebacteria bacterium]
MKKTVHVSEKTGRLFLLFIAFFLFLALWVMPGCKSSNDAYYSITPSPTTVGEISGIIYAAENVLSSLVSRQSAAVTPTSITVPAAASSTAGLSPVPDAEVWLEDMPSIRTVTDSRGVYLLKMVPPGEHKIVGKFRHKTQDKVYKNISEEINLTIRKLESGGNDLILQQAPNFVSGRLRDVYGRPLPFVTMTLWGESFQTDPDGYFTSPPVPVLYSENEIKITPPTGFQALTITTPFQFDIPPFLEVTLNTLNPSNFAPTVVLYSDKIKVQPNETITITATAKDDNPDDQKKLTAIWETTAGKIATTANQFLINWTAPAIEGLATLSITVRDPFGATAGVYLPLLIGISDLPIDTIPPKVAAFFPASGSTEVASTTEISLTFSESVIASSVQRAVILLNKKRIETVLNPPKADSQLRTFTFTPFSILGTDTEYTVEVKSGKEGPLDFSGNGLQKGIVWAFTTSDNPRPVEFNPPDRKPDVPINSSVSVKFSKAVDPDTVNEYSFQVSSGSEIFPGKYTISSDKKTATFAPFAIFPVNANIKAELATSIRDINGLPLIGNRKWTFTTRQSPYVSDFSPENDAWMIPVNTPLSVTFSEPMDIKSLTGAMTLKEKSTGIDYRLKAPVMNSAGTIATWDYYFPLNENEIYTATLKGGVNGAKSSLGIPVPENVSWYFLTIGVAPSIISKTPSENQTDVFVKSSVAVTFSESIENSTVNEATFVVSSGSVPIMGTVTLTNDDKVASFTPLSGTTLPFSSILTASIKPGIRDKYGNTLENEVSWNFSTEHRPQVVVTSPANGAASIPIDVKISAGFNKLVAASTLNEQSFTVFTDSYSIPGSVTVAANGLLATFTPSEFLPHNTRIYCKINSDIRDGNGNNSAENYEWSFVVDPHPIVLSYTPADGSPAVGSETYIVVKFSDMISESTITDQTFPVTSGGSAVAGQRYLSDDKKTLTFKPFGNRWPSGSQVYVSITTDVKSVFGATLKEAKSWTFLTDTRPAVVSVFPEDNSVNVATNSVVTVVLSKNINPNSLNSNTFTVESSGQLIPGTISQIDERTISFKSSTALPQDSDVYVTVSEGIKDFSGNPCVEKTWKFTTDANPRVVAYFPANGLVGVATSTEISAFFNEAIDLRYLNASAFKVFASGTIPITSKEFKIGADYMSATFTPLLLPYGSQITVSIASNIRDLNGNGLLQATSWSFITDYQPVVEQVYPVENMVNASVSSVVSAVFSKTMATSTINSTNFRVLVAGSPVSGVFSYSFDNKVATFTPTQAFPFGTRVDVILSENIKDSGSNPIVAKSWSFETDFRPYIVSKSPENGTTGVATMPGLLAVNFSEPMKFSTFSNTSFYISSGSQKLDGSFNFTNNDKTIEFSVSGEFPNNANLEAHMTTGLTDYAGYSMLNDQVWSFTTDYKPFATNITIAPDYGTTSDVATGPVFTAWFNEKMRSSTLNASNIVLTQSGTPVSLDTFSIAGDGKSVSFKPASPLAYGTSYLLTVKTSAKDDAGNDLQEEKTLSFTTDVKPEVVSGSALPANGTIEENKQPTIMAAFSKTMNQTTLNQSNIEIKDPLGNTISGTMTPSATGFSFVPSSNLPKGKVITVKIKTNVLDNRGNPLSSEYSWNFTTVTNVAIAAGASHTVVITNKGTVYSCGDNSNSQLGYSLAASYQTTPTAVTSLSSSFISAIAGGRANSAFLTNAGSVFMCGLGTKGQIGDGGTLNRVTPVQSLLDSYSAISVGGFHTLALKGGKIYSWGDNGYGQLGMGVNGGFFTSPSEITSPTDVVAVSAGLYHSVALTSSGDVYVWGKNVGTVSNFNTPQKVATLNSIIAISAGDDHALALRSSGGSKTLYSWGANDYGELGNGTTNYSLVPAAVSLSSTPKSICTYGKHSVVLFENGTVAAWGLNDKGQVTGTAGAKELSPVTVSGLSGITAISSGYYFTAALKDDGNVMTWGDNSKGQLGRTSGGSSPAASNF